MMTCEKIEEIAEFSKENPELDFGIHLTVTSEWKNYKWDGVLEPIEIPSLLNKNGATAWEYYDLIKDPLELKNEFYNPDYKNEILKLHQELIKEKQLAGDKETLIPNINEV